MNSINKIAAMTPLAVVFALSSVAPGFAGAVGGSRYDNFSIRPFATDSFNVTFRGGELARVYVLGDGSTDLDLYVCDQYGRCIAFDNDSTDECLAQWVPSYTATYTIKIVNRGGYYNDYGSSRTKLAAR